MGFQDNGVHLWDIVGTVLGHPMPETLKLLSV